MTRKISLTYKHAQIQRHEKEQIQQNESTAFLYLWYKKSKQGASSLFIRLLMEACTLKTGSFLFSDSIIVILNNITTIIHFIIKTEFTNLSMQEILYLSKVNNVRKQDSEEPQPLLLNYLFQI